MTPTRLTLLAAAALCIAVPALANGARDSILDGYLTAAKAADPAFQAFSAARGETLFRDNHGTGKPDTPACTTCHTETPQGTGRTRAGKEIKPIAVSANPTRFTDPAEVEKWFGRNCNSVLGRECTPAEKGDFITFMMGQ